MLHTARVKHSVNIVNSGYKEMTRAGPFVFLTRLSAHGDMNTNRQSAQGASPVRVHTEGSSTGISIATSCAFLCHETMH